MVIERVSGFECVPTLHCQDARPQAATRGRARWGRLERSRGDLKSHWK